jgi:hypothetical protein
MDLARKRSAFVSAPGTAYGERSPWLSLGGNACVVWIIERSFGRGRLAFSHSSRNRINGSTDSARCAGTHVDSRPSSAMAATTPPSTNGSRGLA